MKVRPSSPLVTNFGLWVCPVRGVTAESRTKWPKFVARLRSAGFFKVCLNMGAELGGVGTVPAWVPASILEHIGRNS